MEFDYKWLEGEARDGFYVSSMMKRAWAAQLEMLQDIDEACQQNNIRYFADWGTLLGAVRHRGFIPWDDDLDICMLRDDFDRFRDHVQLPSCYSMNNMHTESEYEDFLNRIVNAREITMEDEHLKKFSGFPYVAGIDIFPLDYLPRDEQRQNGIREEVLRLTETIHTIQSGPAYSIADEENRKWQVNRLYKEIEKVYASCKDEDADELTIMAIWMKNPDYRMEKNVYEKMIRIPFEQTTICVPADYDYLLSKKFGMYVKSVREWDSHNFPFYTPQEEVMQNAWGYALGIYQFQEADLIRNSYESKRPVDYVMDMIPLWKAVLKQVVKLQKGSDVETALQLLEKCQEMAIASGNNLDENSWGKQSEELVHLLETFCEVVFQIHEQVIHNAEVSETVTYCQKCVDRLSIVAAEFAQKKRVGIVIDRVANWKKLKVIYKEVLEQGHDVYVIPIPFYEKNYKGEAAAMHFEGKLLPEGLHILDYNANYGINGFDVLIYTNPFDDVDLNTTVHPFFYSAHLQKIGKKIIFADILQLDDFDEQDKRSQRMLDYYLKLPGVLHADEIWVSTENHRIQYKKALADFAGEETEKRWDERIKVHLWKKECPEGNAHEEGVSRKKKLACFIDCSNVLQHGADKIRKLNEMVNILKQNIEKLDICLFYERVCMDSIRTYDENIFAEFEMWLEKAKTYFEVRDSVTMEREELETFDAYYGDQGYLANQMIRMKRPVMIQSVEMETVLKD